MITISISGTSSASAHIYYVHQQHTILITNVEGNCKKVNTGLVEWTMDGDVDCVLN